MASSFAIFYDDKENSENAAVGHVKQGLAAGNDNANRPKLSTITNVFSNDENAGNNKFVCFLLFALF